MKIRGDPKNNLEPLILFIQAPTVWEGGRFGSTQLYSRRDAS